ncbi:Protein PHYTOCHROME KINASE SUBSTRATE 4, partial [Cucurbita argyrosperma subsp. sororia]
MERRAISEMSFINGSLSEKTVFGCNNNNDTREKREASSTPSYLTHSDAHHRHFLARCSTVDDSSELSIFDAKKYFNEVSTNNTNKVSPVTNIESMSESEKCNGHSVTLSQDQDFDQDSELSKSKPWTCGVVTHPSSLMLSKFSPSLDSIDGYHRRSYRARSFRSTTPTASSEASWNSQTGLLSNPPGAISVSVLRGDTNHHSGRKSHKPSLSSSTTTRWSFRSSKCPCTGKKSIQVQESKVVLEPKTSPPYTNNNTTVGSHSQLESELESESSLSEKTSGANKILLQQSDNNVIWSTQRRFPPNLLLQEHTTQRVIASTGFTFPILKKNANNNEDIPTRSISHVLIEDPPRDSLEVFKPSTTRDCGNNGGGGGGGGSLKSRILASVAASGGTATIVNDVDDVASDASSDLFEIESFSAQTVNTATVSYPAMFHRRDSMELEARKLGLALAGTRRSLDEPMTPSTDWYEPSEASIDWSITTAEGFDRASITNMSETEEPWIEKNNNNTSNNNNRRRSSSGNGLLSCRSEKAVSVGPQPVTKHVGSRPPLAKKPPLARSNSAHHSLTFAA